MDDFTINTILNAINIANTPANQNQDQSLIQNALSYLEQWTYSENGIFLATQILVDPNFSPTHKFYAATLIKTQIPSIWGKIPKEARVSIRNQVFDFFKYVALDENHPLFNMIVDILVNIALFEFPDEWPDLNLIFFSNLSNIDNELERAHYFSFIGQFISSIDMSKLITPKRIQFLRNLLLANSSILYSHVTTCFSNENLVPDGLKIFNGFLKWSESDQIMPSLNLFRDICFRFVLIEKILPQTLECIKTLLLRRIDSMSFASIVPMVVCSLSSPTSILPDGKHITSDSRILNFLLAFLTEYMTPLLYLFDPTNSSGLTESMKKTMEEMQFGPQDLSQRLLYIINVFLSIRNPELLNDEYWSFWSILFNQIHMEINNNQQDCYKPTYEFVKGIIPSIRESLFQCLPYDHYNDEMSDVNVKDIIDNDYSSTNAFDIFFPSKSKNTWSTLATIDFGGMIKFLKEQSPSVALCYGIGNLELCQKSTFDLSLLNGELTELYNFCQSGETNPEFFISLLYCISHTLSFDKDGQFYMNFIEFAIKCAIDENPPITTAATNALYYASRRAKSNFLNEQSISTICEYSETYLKKLEHDDAVRMFKMAASLISLMSSNEQMSQLYEKLATPLILAMDAFFELDKIFDCMKEACECAHESSQILMSFLWPKVLDLTNQVIHSDQPNQMLDKIIDADSIASRNEPFNEERFNLILSWMVEKNQINLQNRVPIDDCFYNFISVVHSRHREIDKLFPNIIQTFVEPAVSTNLINLAPTMTLLNSFGIKSLELPFYVTLINDSIRSLNIDDNVKGIEGANFFINNNSNPQRFAENLNNNNIPSILSSVFSSLTDMMHKNLTVRLIQIVRNILNKASQHNVINTPDFTNIFLSAIKQNVEEPMPNMFLNFFETIKKKAFGIGLTRVFSDFLILIKRMSPNDADVFKADPQEENSNQGSFTQVLQIQ
ncbi:hypothetical protein M9Y10_008256 [Tritrichomonas musculus]|uniref:Importin N-terminal domain-containing protein n=1 Tax=Tritrichomonas musculus TaxID=1915356 RepID=A0ABR2IYQ9_9EUKA